jgi:hypothetical protein
LPSRAIAGRLASNAGCSKSTSGGSVAACLRGKNMTEIVAADAGLPSGGLVDVSWPWVVKSFHAPCLFGEKHH